MSKLITVINLVSARSDSRRQSCNEHGMWLTKQLDYHYRESRRDAMQSSLRVMYVDAISKQMKSGKKWRYRPVLKVKQVRACVPQCVCVCVCGDVLILASTKS